MEKQKVYRLRPHHGMCLAYFEGKGYSNEFTVHMSKMLELLEKRAYVQLTVSGDEICSVCPNLQDGVCVTAEIVKEYDRKVLEFCDILEGEIMLFSEFVRKVQKYILQLGRRSEICGKCEWNEICREKSSRWEIRENKKEGCKK